jgi:hypothetical protein
MLPIQSFANAVLAEVVRRQPPSPPRTAFAWQLAVGAALARASAVELDGTVLLVRARDAHWAAELAHARETVLLRMQHLLGRQAVTALRLETTPPSHQRTRRAKGDRSHA